MDGADQRAGGVGGGQDGGEEEGRRGGRSSERGQEAVSTTGGDDRGVGVVVLLRLDGGGGVFGQEAGGEFQVRGDGQEGVAVGQKGGG